MPIPEPPVFENNIPKTEALPQKNEQLPDYLVNLAKGLSEQRKKDERVLHTQQIFSEVKSAYDISQRDFWMDKRYAWFSGKGQWDERVRQAVEKQGRSAAVINRSAVQHNSVSGAERQNRTETKAFAFGTEDQIYSDSLTAILKRNHATNDLKYKNSQMFMNGNLVGEDYMEAFWDNKRQKFGEIRWISRNGRFVYVDPDNREYDLNDDARFVYVFDFIDVRELATEHPDIPLAELAYPTEDDRVSNVESSSDNDDYRDSFPDGGGYGFGFYNRNPRPFYDDKRKKIKRIRFYEKYLKKVLYLVDNNVTNLDFMFTEVESNEHADQVMNERIQFHEQERQGILSQNAIIDAQNIASGSNAPLLPVPEEATPDTFELVTELENRISYHMISGRHELEYIADIGKNFPVIRYCSFFLNGQIISFNELFEHAQKEINSMHSKLESMLKRANWLNIIEEGAMVSGQDINNVNDTGTLYVKTGKLGAIRTHVNPGLNYIPAYIALLQQLSDDLKEASGVKDPSLGKSPGANTAGVTIDSLKAATNQILQPMIDNYNYTKKIQARTTLEMSFRYLPPEVLQRVVEDQSIQEDPGGRLQKAITNQDDNVGLNRALRELTKMSWDIILDEGLSTPNLKMARAQILITAAQAAGVPPPIGLIAKLMDMPEDDKNEWIAQTQQIQEQAALQQTA